MSSYLQELLPGRGVLLESLEICVDRGARQEFCI